MKQRTTRDDPDGFMDTFFRASRLHYIGTWKHRYEAFLEDLPAPPPLPDTKRGDARVVMHVDMDCFFAAVATLGRPELRGLPVAVSWSSGAKGAGELSSCNYEARAFGCRAGGRVADALRRCPNLVVMPYEFEKYSAVALEVYRILHERHAARHGRERGRGVHRRHGARHPGGRSSRDETSKADSPTGTPNETKRTPKELAEFVRERVRDETGCVASVGIGPNRLIARLATMRAKPNGVFEVSSNEAEAYVASLPVRNLPGVGRGALEKLSAVVSPAGDVKNEKNGKEANACIACRDVLRVPSERLQRALGRKSALSLVDACRGIDRRDWVSRPPRKSVGAQVTWGVRFDEASEVVAFAAKLAGEVSARAVRLKVKGRCLTVKVLRAVANVPDGMMKGSVGHGVCDHLTRSVTLSSYADGAETLAREAMNILAALAVPAGEIRGMGLQLSKLDSDPASASRGASDLRRTARLHAKPAGRRTEWAERGEAIERRYAGWFDGGRRETENKKRRLARLAARREREETDESAREGERVRGGDGQRDGRRFVARTRRRARARVPVPQTRGGGGDRRELSRRKKRAPFSRRRFVRLVRRRRRASRLAAPRARRGVSRARARRLRRDGRHRGRRFEKHRLGDAREPTQSQRRVDASRVRVVRP
jgi:DNA repair protein REV1